MDQKVKDITIKGHIAITCICGYTAHAELFLDRNGNFSCCKCGYYLTRNKVMHKKLKGS